MEGIFMPLDLHYIANLNLGSQLRDQDQRDEISFEIHDMDGKIVDKIIIDSVCTFDSGRVGFLNMKNPGAYNHGNYGCWIIRAMVKGKPATAWTSANDDIVKRVWLHLVECRLIENGCKGKELISKGSRDVQLTLMAICQPEYPELFEFITGRLGKNGLNCISAYDEFFTVIPFFYNTTIVVPGRKMIDVIFGGWLSKVFIDVYLNNDILIDLRSAIHESLTSYAFTSQKKADHVLGIFEEHRGYFSKNKNAETWEYVHNWYSLIAGKAKAPLKINLKNPKLSNQLEEVMFGKVTPLDRLIKTDFFPNVVKSGDYATIEALIKHGGKFTKAHSNLDNTEKSNFLKSVGEQNVQNLFNIENVVKILNRKKKLTQVERDDILGNEKLISGSRFATNYKGLMQVLKNLQGPSFL
jgi:hypothetical protein